MNTPQLQRTVFLLLLAAVSIAFLWVLAPLWGAVFWAVLMAILFHPLFDALCRRLKGRRNAAALLTLLVFLLIVVRSESTRLTPVTSLSRMPSSA